MAAEDVRLKDLLPDREEVIAFTLNHSGEALILSVFLLVVGFEKDVMASLQLGACLVLLLLSPGSVEKTARPSQVFTASAGAALLLQLVGMADLRWIDNKILRYFGLAFDAGIVCRQLFIIILAKIDDLLHSLSHAEAADELEMTDLGPEPPGTEGTEGELPAAWQRALRPQVDPVTEARDLLLGAPQMAAVAIVFVASMMDTVWCLPSLLTVGAFYISGDMVLPPQPGDKLPERAKMWMKVMSSSLFIGMCGELGAVLWLPPLPGLPPKPRPFDIGSWDMCRFYDPWSPELERNLDGVPCIPGTEDCVSQRERCGRDVQNWLCLASGLRVQEFLVFFVMCWILRRENLPQTERPRWVRRTMAFVSTHLLEPMDRRTTMMNRESKLKLLLMLLATLLTWLAMCAAFLTQRQDNIVALGYLWLGLVSTSSVSNATLYSDPVRAVLWPARAVGAFSFGVVLASAVCQVPSFPCPYPTNLVGLRGEVQTSRFLSGEQCLRVAQTAVGSDASDAWMLGSLFQSFGMVKTAGQFDGNVEELVHWLVFTTCLVQRILVERWNETLRSHFERRKALLEFRAQWYAEKLAASRQVQLSMWDTKRQVLLHKLSRLTHQLNTLRSIWDGQRPAFTEKEAEENLQAARVEHICLQGGVNELLVKGLLREFTNACGELQALPSHQRINAQAIIDKGVVEYLHRRYLRKLKMITSADETMAKKRLIQECKNGVELLFKECDLGEEAPHMPPSSSLETISEPSEEDSRPRVATPGSFTSEFSGREREREAAKPDDYPWLAELCGACVDDMLFIREDDETLYEHRKGNSPVLLFCKALLSQSLLALVVASALQFMAFRSLTASVSISIVVLALMAFPHVPWSVWVLMQWFNLTVIFAKVVFQLPLFCEDGRLNFFGCRPLCGTEMPWTVLLGLLKTRQNANDPCSLALPSLTQLLWPDVLLSVMILLVMCAARLGGRFGSTSQILASLKILEKKNRRMSTHINREMLKAALGPELEEEDEEHGGRGSGTHLDEDETHRASRARLHLSSLTSVEFREQAYNWLKAYVVGAAHVRKPAMDLYEFRLCIALTCLGILIFGWSTMVDSGRSFSKSLQANNFSGNQVRVLVLFLMMIVVDRALYTWYRCDHIREDECGQVKDSWTWKGIMARVLQKVNVVVHIISIHVLFIRQWSRKLVQKDQLNLDVSLLSASTLSGFYVLYVTYLALSSLQLKYDVHVMRGGLRFCHSTDIGSMLVFKVYSALPFLNELRVITDWTVTETSMNLFMWLKLEDAHHGLYRTRLDMEGRAMTEPAEARPMFEKVYMGVALLFLLLVLLVGPIIFFSALNTFMLVPSMVMSATMSVDVKVEASHGHRSLNLYQAAQDYISLWSRERENLFRKTLLDHEMPFSLQDVRFPATSDEFWERSPLMQKMMADQMNPISNPDVVVKLRLAFQFQRNSSVTASGLEEVVLGNETRRVLAEMLSQPEKQRTAHSFEVPEVFENYRRIGDGADISSVDFIHDSQMAGKAPLRSPIKMMFKPADDSHPPCWLAVFNETEEPLKVTVVSNNVKSGAAGSDKETKMSINGLYLGVVLTIGNLFRSIFKDSSKRMIYEEVSDTDLLLDLCDGIYLARVQGNLRAEWELYHELLRIYRSPELLAHVSSKKGHGEKPKPDAPASSARWDRVAVHLRSNAGQGTREES